MEIRFSKMEGTGNDFIVMDDRNGSIEAGMPYPRLAKELCDRHFGIGADGIILVRNSEDHDIRFVIYNSDGSRAGMCGNGMRCFARYLYENHLVDSKQIRVQTDAGTVIPEVITDADNRVCAVKVDMGPPVLSCREIPFVSETDTAIEAPIDMGDGRIVTATVMKMGNPHAVVFVDDLSRVDLASQGRAVEIHPRFPEKTNVEFIQVMDDRTLKMKVWERGAGITLACGTGACAALVASHLTQRTQNQATVLLDGGKLSVAWDKDSNHLYKTGPARLVFEGCIQVCPDVSK
ncbi:MAG TPA: diaminopimelate epimerase [Desulfotignum sp.]|jgi:diaminopimelate epimerase|nr:diaminopimelate epimerase [Desulfotignum sp.]